MYTRAPFTAGLGECNAIICVTMLAAVLLTACETDVGQRIEKTSNSIGKAILEYSGGGGGSGTMFKVAANRFVTNHHVIDGHDDSDVKRIFARFPKASESGYIEKDFSVIAVDRRRDLALLSLEEDIAAGSLPVYNGKEFTPNFKVFAAGYPGVTERSFVFERRDYLEPIVVSAGTIYNYGPVDLTSGRVSQFRPTHSITHSAVIARGNSGGPLLTPCGAVLGVNTQTAGSAHSDDRGYIEQNEYRQASDHSELIQFLSEHNVDFTTDSDSCQHEVRITKVLTILSIAVAIIFGVLFVMWLRFRPLLRLLRDATDRILHPRAELQEFVLQGRTVRIPVKFRSENPRSYLFGRDPSRVDIVLKDDTISRAHFEVGYEGGPQIRDLGSLNGTSVNGTRCGREWYPLSQGDRISAGSLKLEVIKV